MRPFFHGLAPDPPLPAEEFSLPVAGAFGMALGFYPGVRFILPSLAIATLLAALGAVVLSVGNRSMRLRRMQLLAAAIGLAAGAAIALGEAGGAEKIEDEAPGAVGGSAGIRTGLAAAPPRLGGRSARRRLLPAKNGFRSYPLRSSDWA